VVIGFLVTLSAGFLGWRLLNLYSGSRDYEQFLPPTREFLRAGLALDSAGLARLSGSSSAVQWALQAGRRNPVLLRTLLRNLRVGHGSRNGDNTLVLFSVRHYGSCTEWPLTVFFAGPRRAPRIEEIKAGCESR
jgi:hypothetical protein